MSANMKYDLVSYNPFAKGEVKHVVPMTQSQIEIWLSAQQSEDASRAFNLSMCMSFKGSVNIEKLQESFMYLGQRHEALRTTFSSEKFAMIVYEDYQQNFERIKVAETDKQKAEVEIKLLEKERRNCTFDLVHGPLFNIHIFETTFNETFVFVVAHHIIADGWSLDLFSEELVKVYSAKVKGTAPSIDAAGSIAEYNLENKQLRASQRYLEHEQFWVDKYSSSIPVLDLPILRSRPLVRAYSANRVDLELDVALSERLNTLLPQLGSTFFSLAYGVYVLLMYKISGQNDIAVGVPYAGQVATGNKNLFGHCVNMLPVRHHVEDSVKIKKFLTEIQRNLLEAKDNGLLTFSDLISKVNVARDSSRIPIISTTFNIDEGDKALNVDNIAVAQEYNPRDYETFELATTIVKNASQLKLQCQYNTSLYQQHQIENWLSIYESILVAICDNTEATVAELDIVSKRDQQLFDKWNATEFEYDKAKCIGDFLEDTACKYPGKVAVTFENDAYTYQELHEKSNALAHYLIDRGVKPDQFIGLYIERSVDTLLILLGVLKSGAGYLPLDPEYPKDRIAFILEDARANILISQKKLKNNIPVFSGELILQDDLPDIISNNKKDTPVTNLKSHNLAYTIYTSGSTGKPKGVQVTHQNAVNFLLGMLNKPGLSHKDKLLAVTTISFDIHVLEMYLPLVCGATVEIASRELAINGEALLARLNDSEISIMQATPSTWRMMIEAGWTSDYKVKALVGGEALPKDILPILIKNTNELWNMYGPTETTVWSTCKLISNTEGPITVGKPIANTQLYVLDKNAKRVPIGTAGELYIGGDGVTNGYLYRPDLNKKTFLADPYTRKESAKIYKTGDEVRFRDDGELEYLSRIDNQVKVRGYRIELGEIESTLSQYNSVNQSVVVAREDTPGDVRLVAYYTLNENSTIASIVDLKSFMSTDLPPYMVPQHYIELDNFPLTPNGKIDRKNLPKPDINDEAEKHDFMAPVGDIEKQIAAIWSDLIGVKNIGLMDNFFEIGGHSLLAMKFIVRVREEIGVKLNLQNVILDNLQDLATLCGSTSVVSATVESRSKANRVDTFYFNDKNELYGLFHPGNKKIKKSKAVLICAPVSQDYVRSYRLLKVLADRLADHGYDVLRFDYYGTGDSLGVDSDASCLRWEQDIKSAYEWLKNKTQVNDISVFGARLGASLFMKLEKALEVNHIVLWDPILDGKKHLINMKQLQKNMLRDFHRFKWGRWNSNAKQCLQLSSFNYSNHNVSEIESLSFLQVSRKIDLLVSFDEKSYKEFCVVNQDINMHALTIQSPWYDFTRQEDALTSPEIIETVLKIFEGA